jgi:hypothetical protein
MTPILKKSVLLTLVSLFAIGSALAEVDCAKKLQENPCDKIGDKDVYKACCNPIGNQLAEPACTQESTRAGLKVFGPEITGYDADGQPIYKSSTAN